MMVAFVLLAGLFNYLYQISMGRMLTPVEYGTLLSFLSIFAIISLFSQAIQTSIAKFTSKFRVQEKLGGVNYLWRFSLKRLFLLGLALFLAFTLFTPLISSFLNIDNKWYCFLFATSLVLVFTVPVNCGVLQGLQRFLPLGFSTALLGFLKLSFGLLLVYIGFGVYGGLASLPLAILILFVVTLLFLRDLAREDNKKVEVTGLFSYTGLALLAIVSFGMLTNIDVVLAKHYLSPESAGNYSAISVLGRIALFAPMGVALAMFPKTSELFETGRGHRSVLLKAMILTVLLAGAVVIVYGLFPEFIVSFVFGGKYPLAIPYLFKYGLAMALFALSFLLMNYFLSLNQTKVCYSFLGAVLLQLGLIIFFHSNIAQIVNIMLICSALCLIFMLPLYLKLRKAHL